MDSKKKLFENMEKLIPGFKQPEISEQSGYQQNTQQGVQQYAGDIKSIQNTTTTAQQTAYSRINTPDEFIQAFKVWFSSLGFNPQSNPLAIGRAVAEITKIMKEMGYK
jgi:hypothetical protein